MMAGPPPPSRDGGRRKPSKRRRGAPARYSDDKPDTVTYDLQYGDGRGGETGGTAAASAAAVRVGSKGREAKLRGGTPEPGVPDVDRGEEKEGTGDGGKVNEAPDPKPNGAIAHRVSVVPALRYVRPPQLEAAAVALAQYITTSASAPTPDAASEAIATTAATGAKSYVPASESSSNKHPQQQAPDQKPTRRSSDIKDEEEQRAKAEYENRRRKVLERLKRDPSLSAAFGEGLGLLSRKGQKQDKGGTSGGSAGASGQSTAPPIWDAVRYNDFYYPGDYIDVDEEEKSGGVEAEEEESSSETKRSKATSAPPKSASQQSQEQAPFRPRKRLRPGVPHPVPRAVTVMAMMPSPSAPQTTRNKNNNPHSSSEEEAPLSFRYVAIGDTAGFVTLYVTEPILSPVSRLDTSASQRDYQEELERRQARAMGKKFGGRDIGGAGGGSRPSSASVTSSRPVAAAAGSGPGPGQPSPFTADRVSAISAALDDQLKDDGDDTDDVRSESAMSTASSFASKSVTKRSTGKKKSDYSQTLASQSPNAVEALCFTCSGRKIVVGTKIEVELIDCRTNSILWTCRTDHLYGYLSSTAVADVVAAAGGDAKVDNTAATSNAAASLERMSRGSPIRLSCHPADEDGGILAGYVFGAWSSADEQAVRLAAERKLPNSVDRDGSLISPLLRFSMGRDETNAQAANVTATGVIPFEQFEQEGTGERSRPISMGPRSVAMYDVSNPKRILMVCTNLRPRAVDVAAIMQAQQRGRDKSGHKDKPAGPPPQHVQELLLLDTSSEPEKVVSRALLPAKMAGAKIVTSEAIAQSPRGRYTVAATSARGGIRLFVTEGLEHLATYGEGVALHGHTIMWQDVFFVPRGGSGQEEERDDEVLYRTITPGTSSQQSRSVADDPADLMLVAVPHAFREPVDLNGTVHLWDLADVLWGGTKLPCTTLLAPPRSGGIVTLLYDDRSGSSSGRSGESGGGRFILSTQTGDCQELGPKLVSDWPGRMYPPGYTVLNDNVEYIEDEDELDIVVDRSDTIVGRDDGMEVHSDSDEMMEGLHGEFQSDLRTALERSMRDEDAIVDVLGDDDVDQGKGRAKTDEAPSSALGTCLVAARPEAYLQARIASEDADGDSSGAAGRAGVDVLSLLPQLKEIEPLIEKNFAREIVLDDGDKAALEVQASKIPTISLSKSTRGKRVKSGSLEAILNASIDPKIRAALLRLEQWADGSGSTFRRSTGTNEITCEACLGRMVRHRCGKLLIPIDQDAIAKAEAERKAKEEEEKRQRRLAKKRITDAKRREAKRRKKKEEEEKREAEERAEKERRERELREIEEEERRRMERIRKKEAARINAMAREEEERAKVAAAGATAGGEEYWDQQYNQADDRMRSQEEVTAEEEERRTIALELQNLRAGFPTAATAPAPPPPDSLQSQSQNNSQHQDQYQYQQQRQISSYGTFPAQTPQVQSSSMVTSPGGPIYVGPSQHPPFSLATGTPVAEAASTQSQYTSALPQQNSSHVSTQPGPGAVGYTASSSSFHQTSQQAHNTTPPNATHTYNAVPQEVQTTVQTSFSSRHPPAAAALPPSHKVLQDQSEPTAGPAPATAVAASSTQQYPNHLPTTTGFSQSSAPVPSPYSAAAAFSQAQVTNPAAPSAMPATTSTNDLAMTETYVNTNSQHRVHAPQPLQAVPQPQPQHCSENGAAIIGRRDVVANSNDIVAPGSVGVAPNSVANSGAGRDQQQDGR